MLKLEERKNLPPTFIIYGGPGIGKSTAGASFPKPLFIQAERGLDYIDVPRLPQPKSIHELLDQLAQIATEKHEYKTIVIDTLDAIEPLVHDIVCSEGKKKSIEDFGWGLGHSRALDHWKKILASLTQIHDRGILTLLLAHSVIKPFSPPDADTYDMWQLRMHQKAAPLFVDWAEVVLFATDKLVVDGRRAHSEGERIMFTERRPSHYAKNRLGLPYELPFNQGSVFKTIMENVNKKGVKNND